VAAASALSLLSIIGERRMYRAMGFAHATLAHHLARLRTEVGAAEEGQGTIEYVGLILLIAAVMAGVLSMSSGTSGAEIGKTIVGKLKSSIDGVGGR
jgi:hypothetical protein